MGLDTPAASPGRVEQHSQAPFSSSLSLLIHGMTPVISTHVGELPGGSNPAPGLHSRGWPDSVIWTGRKQERLRTKGKDMGKEDLYGEALWN